MTSEQTGVLYEETILGLDLGTSSVGWCLLAAPEGRPSAIIATGVRVFEAGMEGDIASGRGESRGVARRQARQARRQGDRRARRKRHVFNILQRAGLLPPGKARDVLPELDRHLQQCYFPGLPDPQRHTLAHTLPYWLRTQALGRRLDPHEIGRAIYHLAQRRGFLSNRRASGDDKEEGAVKAGISELRQAMVDAGARTLGEYFASLDPYKRRIRKRWTARDMYVDEFGAIWSAQAEHHPAVLTDELRATVHRAVFRQRPLKSAKGLVGPCALDRGARRAAAALPAAQRFRLLQQVNNCKVITDHGEVRLFTGEERRALIDALDVEGDRTFAKAKRLLGLKRTCHFTLEEGGETRFIGNRTGAKLRGILGEHWDGLSDDDRTRIIHDVRSFQNVDALTNRARRCWGLDETTARTLAQAELEPGYSNLSRKAIDKLLPLMEKGVAYSTAVKEVYGEFAARTELRHNLRAVSHFPEIRNPVVMKTLTELRKVVNAVIRKYGKPGRIRVELARDIRQSRKQRQRATARNRTNERARKAAADKVIAETTIQNPRRDDILKVILANECGWKCPYTGRGISMGSLFGPEPKFDIEHIVPFSRSLDDSFLNKTLCYHEENRSVKRNRTPFEAYADHAERWDEIIGAVKRFTGEAANEKLRRFQLCEIEAIEDFASNQLNDTRYASKLAMQYLGSLYGGLWDASGTRRIEASRGGTTAYMREVYGLNGILNDGGLKTRDDHRHHAVDALAVALTSPGAIKMLSDAAVRADQRRDTHGRFKTPSEPWAPFITDVRTAIGEIVVSHRPSRKINGPLHKETLYGSQSDGNGKTVFVVRKPLEALSPRDVSSDAIVDDVVRQLVRAKLDELGLPPQRAFADPANHPVITGQTRDVPIHRVRVRCAVNPLTVGKGHRRRHVTTEKNHHLEVVAMLDEQRNETKWTGLLVSKYDAMRRLAKRQPVIKTDHGPDMLFKFSITPGDTLRLKTPGKEPELVHVRSVSQEKGGATRIEFVGVRDARIGSEIKKDHAWFKPASGTLRNLGAEKVSVSPLGEVFIANG